MDKEMTTGPENKAAADMTIRPTSRAAYWYEKNLSGDMSDADMETFEAWLDADTENERAYADCSQVWAMSGSLPFWDGAEVKGPENRRAESAAPAANGRPWKYMLMAACLAFACLFGAANYWGYLGEHFETAVGEQRLLKLADGSTVHMNTATELSVHYLPGRRLIKLTSGEAWFDVAKEPDRPFEVSAGPGLVRALGTAFAIRTHEGAVKVTVSAGKVELVQEQLAANLRGPHETPKLVAGEQLDYGARGLLSEVHQVEIGKTMAWRSGKVNFSDASLVEVLEEMNRYSRIPFVIGDEALNAHRLSGVFRIDDIETLLKGLEYAVPVTITRQGDRIVLTARTTENKNS